MVVHARIWPSGRDAAQCLPWVANSEVRKQGNREYKPRVFERGTQSGSERRGGDMSMPFCLPLSERVRDRLSIGGNGAKNKKNSRRGEGA